MLLVCLIWDSLPVNTVTFSVQVLWSDHIFWNLFSVVFSTRTIPEHFFSRSYTTHSSGWSSTQPHTCPSLLHPLPRTHTHRHVCTHNHSNLSAHHPPHVHHSKTTPTDTSTHRHTHTPRERTHTRKIRHYSTEFISWGFPWSTSTKAHTNHSKHI